MSILLTIVGVALAVVWTVEAVVLLVSYRSSGRKSDSAAKQTP